MFNIICFDGGGLKGAFSICMLERIQKIFPNVIRNTNLIGGTSTGSLIALALAYGLNTNEIKKLYSVENTNYIFDNKKSIVLGPKYDNENLKEVLLSVFPEKLKLKDLPKLVMIPSFYIGDEASDWKPIYYNNIPGCETENARVVDVAMASSAVPIIFPTYKKHLDGAIMASNPSLSCLVYALGKELGKKLDDIRLLSIGTGYNFSSIKQDTKDWGAIDWILSKNPDQPIISVTLEANAKTSEIFCKKLLQENYFRIDSKLDKDIQMDDSTCLDYLIDVSNNYDLGDCIKWINERWDK